MTCLIRYPNPQDGRSAKLISALPGGDRMMAQLVVWMIALWED